MTTTPRKRGRPPVAASEQRTVDRHVKLTPAEDAAFSAVAAAESATFSDWARRGLRKLLK
jgi:hypothetical protein